MEELLITAVGYLRLVVEAIRAALIGFGVLATTYRYVLSRWSGRGSTRTTRYGCTSGATSL